MLVDAEGNYLAGGGDRCRAINARGCQVDYPVFAARPVRYAMPSAKNPH